MGNPFRPSRILVPIDFSPSSERAADVAADLARTVNATVVLVHAWTPPIVAVFDLAYVPTGTEVAAQTEQFQEQLRSAAQRLDLPEARVERHLLEGSPTEVITEAVATQRCDLIVMATHGRTGLAHLAMGSVAEHVIRGARVPVLIVPRA